jgi:predicted phage tail protein
MLTTIKLTGVLGEKFKPEIQADVSNLQHVMSCLSANFPEFKSYILSQDYLYEVFIIKDKLEQKASQDNLANLSLMPLQGSTVIIAPAILGSGDKSRGYLTAATLVGIGLIPGIGSVGQYLIVSGISMGLQTLLYGYPDKPKKEENTVFFQASGAVTQEGTPIPLVFGEVLVKSFQVISLDVRSEYKKL